jgi:hypothetical protein
MGFLWAANSQTFTLSASLPAATSVGLTASRVASASGAFTAVTGTSLSFDPMTFQTALGIWLPDHFFAIDIAPVGGAGGTDVVVTYTEGANPNPVGHGLGVKSTATFVKVVGKTETGLTTHGPKKILSALSGEHVLPAEITGGFLRVYLGIVAKDPAALFQDPATSEVFTTTDRAGTYTGTIVFTGTIV